MAGQVTTTGQVDPAVAIYYDRVLLERALPELVHDIAGQRRSISQKSGNTMKFRRYNSLTAATVPVSEPNPPPLEQLSKTDLLAQIQQYIKGVAISDVVDYTVEDNVLNETGDLLGENMGLTYDTIIRDILCASASYYACSAGSNAKTPTELHKTDIDGAVATLLGGNAKFITEVKAGDVGVGTVPVRKCFVAIGHTDEISALEGVTGFTSVANYPKADPMHDAEWGATGNLRWLMSTNAKRISGNPGVYQNLVMARNAYGVIDLEGGAVEHIFKGFDSGDKTDYANQIATMAWKGWLTGRILNDAWMLVLGATNKLGSAVS